MNISTKQFQILADNNLVWNFLVDICDRETGGGDPFYEKLSFAKGIHWTFRKRG